MEDLSPGGFPGSLWDFGVKPSLEMAAAPGVLRSCLGNCAASHLLLKILEGKVERSDLNADEIQVKDGIHGEESWRCFNFQSTMGGS